MKKFFITLAVLALGATAASAQQLSVSAGYLNSSFLSSDDKTDAFNGFTVGVGATKYLNEYVGVATGLYYSFSTRAPRKDSDLADSPLPERRPPTSTISPFLYTLPERLTSADSVSSPRQDLHSTSDLHPAPSLPQVQPVSAQPKRPVTTMARTAATDASTFSSAASSESKLQAHRYL